MRLPDDESTQLLTELCETMKLGSLCAHGGAIPIPIASLMVHFREEMLGGTP